MTPFIRSEELLRYQASSRKQQAQREQRCWERQQQGLQVARQAAHLLQKEFGVTQVKLFGSLLELRRVHAESDVDLAVAGLSDDRYWEVVTRLLDLSSLSVDLIQIEHAAPGLQATICQQGVDL